MIGFASGDTLVDILLWSETFFFGILVVAIIVQSLLSMLAPQGVPGLSRLLYDLSQPVLGPIRRAIPPFGMIDLSPMFAILFLWVAGWIVEYFTALLAGV